MNNNSPDSEAHGSSSSLPKKTKGRLKKLLKRANVLDTTKHASGLFEVDEWIELQQLLELQQGKEKRHIFTPRIAWRSNNRGSKGKNQDEEVIVDASDHRDLLFRFVSPRNIKNNNNKKRKLETNNEKMDDDPGSQLKAAARVPSWASLHNSVLIDQAAVLEFHCTSSHYKALQEALDECLLQQTDQNKDNMGCFFGANTRWFTGLHHPKSMSHALMYGAAPKPPKTAVVAPRLESLKDVYQALLALAVPVDVLKSEGYPLDCSSQIASVADPPRQPVHVPSSNHKCNDDQLLPVYSYDVATAQARIRDALVPVLVRSMTTKSASPEELRDEASSFEYYVSTISSDSREHASTNDSNESSTPRILALDCEMVQTTVGRELARITLLELVEYNPSSPPPTSRVVVRLDQLVRPRGTVLDYLTNYSGITAEMYNNEESPAVDLSQVQAVLLDFVSGRDILVGHSLENDLHAVQWVHSPHHVIDTALLFRACDQKFKHSLRNLSLNLLKKTIQQEAHCSHEDAETALELALQRAIQGPSFAGHLLRSQPINQLVLLTRHANAPPVVCMGSSEWLQQYVETRSSIHALTCDSVTHPNHKALTAWLTTTNPMRRASLVYASWRLSSSSSADDQYDNNSKTPAGSSSGSKNKDDVEKGVNDALALIHKLRSQLGTNTMICVALQRDYHRTVKLTEQRKARRNPKATMAWTQEEEDAWTRAIYNCRLGKVYWIPGSKE